MPKPRSPLQEEHLKLWRWLFPHVKVEPWEISATEKPINKCKLVPLPCGSGHILFNPIAVLLLVNRQSVFAKQRPAWARSDDHTGSIVPCVKKTFWVCGLQGSSFDANTKLHKMFDILFSTKPQNTCSIKPSCCIHTVMHTFCPCIHL